jgi:hypothetical protein
VREVYPELVRDPKRCVRGIVFLGASLLTALTQLTHLPRRRESQVAGLVGRRMPDLLRDRFDNDLRELSRARPRYTAVGLAGRVGTAVLLSALSRLSVPQGTRGGLPELSDFLADAADRLPSTLAELSERLPGAADQLVEIAGCLPRALSDVADGLSGPLSDVADCLSGPLSDVPDGLPSSLADVAYRLARTLADILERPLGALPDLLGGVPGLVDCLTRTLANLGDCAAQPLYELGVAIEARHEAVDDRGDVIEPGLQHGLHLDALYVELDSAEVDIDADVELDEIEHVRLDGEVSVEVVQLEMDQVDSQLRHVE